MRDHDDLTRRLRDLAARPADRVRADHLHAMRAAGADAAPAGGRRFGRLAVAAAAIVGFAVGSTGFAMAGALPDPAQGVAHDVLSVVQVDVPDRGDGMGACMSEAAKRTGEEKRAAKDACKAAKRTGRPTDAGAPGRSGEAPGRPAEAGPHPNADTSDCKGKPPWAAEKRKPTAEERAAREACPEDDDGVGDEAPAG